MEVDESVAAGYQRSHREIELERAFESACEQEWVKNAEVNDVLHRMMTYLPQRMWLELNGHHGVVECCPLLSVHFLLGIPFETLSKVFEPVQWGRNFKWPSNKGSPIFSMRSTSLNGLKLAYRGGAHSLPHAVWMYLDRSGAGAYRGPGDDYPPGHCFRRRARRSPPW